MDAFQINTTLTSWKLQHQLYLCLSGLGKDELSLKGLEFLLWLKNTCLLILLLENGLSLKLRLVFVCC